LEGEAAQCKEVKDEKKEYVLISGKRIRLVNKYWSTH